MYKPNPCWCTSKFSKHTSTETELSDFQIMILTFMRKGFKKFSIETRNLIKTYSSSDNLTPPISRILICLYLIFSLLTSPTYCNSPRKVRQLNIRRDKKLGFQVSHRQPQKVVLEKFC